MPIAAIATEIPWTIYEKIYSNRPDGRPWTKADMDNIVAGFREKPTKAQRRLDRFNTARRLKRRRELERRKTGK